ncbi:unnamed protein product, partial [marine sediment metagenome]
MYKLRLYLYSLLWAVVCFAAPAGGHSQLCGPTGCNGTDSYTWDMNNVIPDGAQCAAASDVTLGTGPTIPTIVCTDNDAGIIEGFRVMPDSWTGGPVTFEANYVQSAADTDAVAFDVAAQCCSDTELFDTRTSNKAYEDRMRVAGLGRLALKPEGTPVAFDDPVQGARTRVVHQTYALGFRVTMEMYQDELFGIIEKMPADLGDSARDHQERLAWDLINDGNLGARHTVLDDQTAGAPLFAATHIALKSGDTQTNT